MIALSLYYGFTSTGVDNWCHVGGLISGFFCHCFYIAERIDFIPENLYTVDI